VTELVRDRSFDQNYPPIFREEILRKMKKRNLWKEKEMGKGKKQKAPYGGVLNGRRVGMPKGYKPKKREDFEPKKFWVYETL
jgi:hypothetical protein